MIQGLHLSKIRLKNTPLFKDAEFEFTPGISVVYGLNRTNARTSGNGNGAGKSAFFSQIGEILYEVPIVGERQDALKGGSRKLTTTVGRHKVKIDRAASKLDIVVDGKAKKFRTKPLARKWLARTLPINQEEYNTYVHIDARVPHPLVMGSSTERRKFFTSFFGLDKLDLERKLFNAELAKLAKVRAAYAEVLSEYKTTKEKALDKDTLQAKRKSVAALQAELEYLNAKNVKLQMIAQLLSFEVSAKPQLKALRAMCPNEIGAAVFEDLTETTRANLRDNKAGLEDAQAWVQYQRDTEHYTKAFESLSDDARKLVEKIGLKEARIKCKTYADKLLYIVENIHAIKRRIEENEKVAAHKLATLPAKPEVPELGRNEARAKLESLRHQYYHALEFKEGTCGTCGQAVEIKSTKKLKASIKELEAVLASWEEVDEYKASKARREDQEARIKEAKQGLKEDQLLLSTESEARKRIKRYADLVGELANVPRRPQKFEGRKIEVKVMQRMVDEDRERIQLLNFLRPNLDTILALQGLTEKQRASGSMAERLQKRLNEIHEKLSKLRAHLEVNAVVEESVGRLKKRLLEMKAELVNEDALKLLVESYSDKAMKRMAVQAISSRLMTEVNKYSRYVFPEDYNFEFKWDSSQLQLLVHRKYEKRVLTSDVRKLSGAESKLFTLVLVLALLTFVPARKRCNFMILDEPSATFSLETLERFKALLPILNRVIPTIVVITPRTDERYENATEWTVVKEKGTSFIKQGHPSTLRKLETK